MIDIPSALLHKAKAMAARRGTLLKAIIEQALERELYYFNQEPKVVFKINGDGVPYLPPRGVQVTSELVGRLRDG
tara:strand:+ start:289 stop:513 length:225 start_codon:yes stop_codon:yes gene_type:complete